MRVWGWYRRPGKPKSVEHSIGWSHDHVLARPDAEIGDGGRVTLMLWRRDELDARALRIEMTYSEVRSFVKQAEAYMAEYPESQGREEVSGAPGT